MPFYVYALVDPRDSRVRYVGQSSNPELRLRAHLTDVRISHKTRWLTQLRRLKLEPQLVTLSRHSTRALALKAEVRWITKHPTLTNMTTGGDGFHGHHTPATRALMRVSFKGHPVSPETRAKIGRALKGRVFSAETIKRMSIASTGRTFSRETRAKLSTSLRGRSFSAEHRAALGAARKRYASLEREAMKRRKATSRQSTSS